MKLDIINEELILVQDNVIFSNFVFAGYLGQHKQSKYLQANKKKYFFETYWFLFAN